MGKNPLTLDSKAPSISYEDFAYRETRFKMLTKSKPERAKTLIEMAQKDTKARWQLYQEWAAIKYSND
jgi:pyruvate-ferredoxin/flavodoxin oxidoreductase